MTRSAMLATMLLGWTTAAAANDCIAPGSAREAVALGEGVLLIDAGDTSWRATLVPGCATPGPQRVTLVPADPLRGVCAGDGSALRLDGQDCAVATLEPMPTPTLQAALAAEPQGKGFARRQCFDTQRISSWHKDDDDTIVVRSRGGRRYRVELFGGCPELTRAVQIQFDSPYGIGLICGNPGDRIVPLPPRPRSSDPLAPDFPEPMLIFGRGCYVSEVAVID